MGTLTTWNVSAHRIVTRPVPLFAERHLRYLSVGRVDEMIAGGTYYMSVSYISTGLLALPFRRTGWPILSGERRVEDVTVRL